MGDQEGRLALVMTIMAPTLLGIAGVIALALPLRLFDGLVPTPLLPLMVIFFWSLYGPEYMPSISTFAIGLLQDLLLGGALGMWAATYLIIQYLTMSQRSYFLGREQHVVWMGFLIAAMTGGIIIWLQTSMLAGSWVTIRPMLWQILVTAATYPVLAIAFSSFHKRVIVQE
jgi:rod shape-determining protein MreD